MKYCVIEIVTQTATFRNPDFQNFHKTLFLPPPTTIIGLAGAAMGISQKKSTEFFESSKIQIGVYGKSSGIGKDLWKYRDLESNRSVIKKEILFKNVFYIAFISKIEIVIDTLEKSFLNPVYALSMGNSDSIAFIKKVVSNNINQLDESLEFEYCVVAGDIINETMSNFDNGLEISIYNTSDPIAYDLPVKFNYESEYGMRNIIERKTFSFIGKKMKLNLKKEGLKHNEIFIPMFSI
jgi:CRISPR-associated protein Cas5t